MIDFEKILNPSQLQAVMHTEGPMLIIAGAGSGKTRVLTYRIANLMLNGVDPFHILALTFTNKAAREMKERIAQVVGESEARNLWMGTFHSVFARILRREADKLGYTPRFSIYDQEDAVKVIKKIIKERALDADVYKPKQIHSRISMMKNSLITPRVYARTPELTEQDELAKRPLFLELYKKYNEELRRANAMDFDDLLLRTNELLARYPEVLAHYQRQFRYIMVDEYQDTNHSQYTIVRALADLHRNIAVVGDDAQSIYSFRGANIQNILNFKKDFPDAAVYKLERNYRSTKNIVGAGNSLIKHNRQKLEKKLWTSNEEGEKVKILRAPSDADEARMIVNDIREQMLRHNADYQDFAVLYRTNSQSRALESALREQRIPFRIYGGMSFFQRKEIKDVLAYLRLLINERDTEALRRIINFPARGIGETTMNKLTVAADRYGKTLFEIIEHLDDYPDIPVHKGIRTKLKNFALMIRSFQVQAGQINVFELTKGIIKQTKLLEAYRKDDPVDASVRLDNIQELLNAMQDFLESQRELADGDPSLAAFLQDVALATDQDRQTDDDPNKVTLMTIHMSKGLEFPFVYIAGMEENLFPAMRSVTSRADLEEERRLLYVAITRAKKRCVLTYAEQRYRWGQLHPTEPSRFLDELDKTYVDNRTASQQASSGRFWDPETFGDDLPFRPERPKRSHPKAKISGSLRPKKLKPLKNSGLPEAESIPPDLHVGDRIRHRKFGDGVIRELIRDPETGHKMAVDFQHHGRRVLLLRYARFEKLPPSGKA